MHLLATTVLTTGFTLIVYLHTVVPVETLLRQATPDAPTAVVLLVAQGSDETAEPTGEATAEVTGEPTTEATTDTTAEPTDELTPEATPAVVDTIGTDGIDESETSAPNAGPEIILAALVLVVSGVVTAVWLVRRSKAKFEDDTLGGEPESRFEDTPPPPLLDAATVETAAQKRKFEGQDEQLYLMLRQLYTEASTTLNQRYVAISELQRLYDAKGHQKELDLERIAIQLANRYGGLIKLEEKRYSGRMISIP